MFTQIYGVTILVKCVVNSLNSHRYATVITRAIWIHAEVLLEALAAERGVTAFGREVNTLSSAACTAHGPTNPCDHIEGHGWRRLHAAVGRRGGRIICTDAIRGIFMRERPRAVMSANVEYGKVGGFRVLDFFIHLQTI